MEPRKAMCSSGVGEGYEGECLCYNFIDKTKDRVIGQVISAWGKKGILRECYEGIIWERIRKEIGRDIFKITPLFITS